MNGSIQQFQAFLFILMRVSPILIMMPVLNSRNLPNLLKAGLALAVALILLPVVKVDARSLPSDPWSFGIFMASELMIGFTLGLSIKVIFTGVQLAGEFSGFQMGLSMANIVDPQSGVDTPLIGEFHYLFGLLIFLSIDGHHWFFKALAESFQVLGPGEFYLKAGLYQHLLHLSGKMFLIGLKLAAPVIAVLILTQISLGMIAKTVPQVNILIISFPLTIGLGMIFLGLSLDLFSPYLKGLFDESGRGLVKTLLPLMKR